MKRIFIFMLSVVICLIYLLPINVSGYIYPYNYKWEYEQDILDKDFASYYNVNIGNIYYNIDFYPNKYTVEMNYAKVKGDTLVIPSTIYFKGKNLKVETIMIDDMQLGAHNGKWKMPYKKIVIPNTVESADFYYAKLTKIKKIYVPKKTRVLDGLPESPKLKVIIDKKNPYIKMKNGALYSKDGKKLWELVNSKKKYRVSKGTKEINFFGVKGVEKVYLPSSLEKITYNAFNSCINLKTVKINNKTKKICPCAFKKCTSLKKIVLPKKLEKIDYNAFSYCTSLKKMTIPNSVKKIGNRAFRNCDLLNNIVLSENMKKINYETFKNCISLKKISIPKNVKKIENKAFKNCKELSEVIIECEEKAPEITMLFGDRSSAFKNTKDGIQFIVKNQTVADQLKEQLQNNKSGVKNAKILIGKKVVYQNING